VPAVPFHEALFHVACFLHKHRLISRHDVDHVANLAKDATSPAMSLWMKQQPARQQAQAYRRDWFAAEEVAGEETGNELRTWSTVTHGDWDFRDIFQKQLRHYNVANSRIPSFFRRWINIKSVFDTLYASPQTPAHMQRPAARGLKSVLQSLGMEFIGRPHSGIDDTRNIAAVAQRLLRDGAVFSSDAVPGSFRPPTSNTRYSPPPPAYAQVPSRSATVSTTVSRYLPAAATTTGSALLRALATRQATTNRIH